ncbi:hypothetical protein MK489_09310, partial [Myxococcota bacterium]|nr:hypothetical protein [Myxococcota bacterium]
VMAGEILHDLDVPQLRRVLRDVMAGNQREFSQTIDSLVDGEGVGEVHEVESGRGALSSRVNG